MKRILIAITIIILVALSATSAAVLAFIEIAPIHAEGRFFPYQDKLEHALLVFYPSPTAATDYELKLMEKRVADLNNVSGTVEEIPRINAVWVEMQHVLQDFELLGDHGDENLRNQFIKILGMMNEELTQYTYIQEAHPEEYSRTINQLDQLITVSMDIAHPMGDILTLSTQLDTPQAQTSSSDATQPVSRTKIIPHKVPFLQGSNGAEHKFFPLTGQHATLTCEGCHSGLTYTGIPNECIACHAAVVPQPHYLEVCSLCHTADGWTPAQFDHSLDIAADCQSCHLRDKPAAHYPGQCSACHGTGGWLPATFDHQVAGATDCQSCHINSKPANHFNGQCSACHSTSGWLPATFNHSVAGATDCKSCHSGNKPANHFSGQCSACHSTSGWRPASFNHSAAGATDCIACHSGKKPANHFSGQCSSCHNTSSWQGATFNHSFPMNHGGANGQCAKCHPSGGSKWTCFTCHDKSKMDNKHLEKGITDYASRCLECHRNGKND